jgi:hypothetical protein
MARLKLLIWIIAGFCAAFVLAACVLGVTGTNEKGIKAALAVTGRLSFLLFWPSYTGSALVTLFGPRCQPIRRKGRDFGLAFASAHLVHLGLVGWLCAIGAAPGAGVFILFGIAAFSLYLLAFLSVPAIVMKLGLRDWRLLRLVTMTYIAYAFAADFLTHKQVAGFKDTLAYLPFSALIIAGFLLRLAAFLAQTRAEPIRAVKLPNVSQS